MPVREDAVTALKPKLIPRPTRLRLRWWAWRLQGDLVVALLATIWVVAAAFLPAGSYLRAGLTLPVLLVVPGYLLIQAVATPARTPESPGMDVLVALGVSPVVVALAALVTSLAPGGFTALPILVAVAVTGFALGSVAIWRRANFAAIAVFLAARRKTP